MNTLIDMTGRRFGRWLVPAEATGEMLDAVHKSVWARPQLAQDYKTMLAARPAVPEEVVERVAAVLDRYVATWCDLGEEHMCREPEIVARAAIRALGGEVG